MHHSPSLEYGNSKDGQEVTVMYETIPVQELDCWLERGYTGRIIDLRDQASYCASHLYGAEHIPCEILLEQPELLSGEGPFLFYCSRGSESLLTCNFFSRRGCRVYNLGGGYRYYRGRYSTAGC